MACTTEAPFTALATIGSRLGSVTPRRGQITKHSLFSRGASPHAARRRQATRRIPYADLGCLRLPTERYSPCLSLVASSTTTARSRRSASSVQPSAIATGSYAPTFRGSPQRLPHHLFRAHWEHGSLPCTNRKHLIGGLSGQSANAEGVFADWRLCGQLPPALTVGFSRAVPAACWR
jgi:hypothetical protein